MRKDKELATILRRNGNSYREISKKLNIPKSTIGCWFRNVPWSEKTKETLTAKARIETNVRIRIMAEKNKQKWAAWRESYRKEAMEEFPELASNPLFITGIMLYWGEGDKKAENGRVSLVNTDERMLPLFIRFLSEICKVPKEKIIVSTTLYPDLSEEDCNKFWREQTGIPKEQFWKTQFIKGKMIRKKVSHGMCTVCVLSRGLKEKILIWIGLASQYFGGAQTRV
ncbi:MAG: hypothetical protein V1905_02815 [bacterium]